MRMFKKLICMSQAGANGSGGGGSSDITITGDTGGPLTSNSFTFTGGTSGLVFNGAGTTETLAVNFDGVALTTANVVTETGNQLGTAVITGGTNVTIDATSTPNQIIINASGGSGGITTINGDTSNTGSSTTPTIYADNTANNCGASVLFSGDATSTLTLNVTDSKGNTHIGNVSGYSNASAFVGESTSIGYGCLAALGTSGNASAADQNTAIGYSVLAGINGSGFINYPKFNTAIGAYSGSNYTGYETNNVLINSNGVMGESNVIRISDSQSNYAPAAAAYIGGIDGVALTTANVVTEVSDQLGTAVITGGTGITIDAISTPNQIIINASGGGGAGTITGNDGTPEAQVGGNWDIVTSNSTVTFAGSAGTETINFAGDSNNNIILGTAPAGIGSGGATLNIGIGNNCLTAITSDTNNIALGANALSSLNGATNGGNNVVLGVNSCLNMSTGFGNVVLGYHTMSNPSSNLTGDHNIVLGANAGGYYLSSENSNILLNSAGQPGDSGVLRIGDGSNIGSAALSSVYINGIDGVALTTANVVTETGNQLGTAVLTPGAGITIDATSTPNEIIIELTPSSERYKESIAPISDSSAILKLQPVTFQYKPNLANISKADAASSHYGFIAEEVQKILPNLTFNDSSGQVNGVRYNEIIPLLLSEIQKLRKDVDDLKGK